MNLEAAIDWVRAACGGDATTRDAFSVLYKEGQALSAQTEALRAELKLKERLERAEKEAALAAWKELSSPHP